MGPLSRSCDEPSLFALITEVLLKFDGIPRSTDEHHRMINAGTIAIRDKLLEKIGDNTELTDIEYISLALIISLHNASLHNASQNPK